MLPGKGAGYTPLDLESNVISGQWRTIEEHERLQQEGAILSTTATDSPESSGPEFADYYGQQRQQISNSRKNIAWIVGGGSGLAWPLAPAWGRASCLVSSNCSRFCRAVCCSTASSILHMHKQGTNSSKDS
jgi:hypothetical protein